MVTEKTSTTEKETHPISDEALKELGSDLKKWDEFWKDHTFEDFRTHFEQKKDSERDFETTKLFATGMKDYYRRISPGKEHRYLFPKGAVENRVFTGDEALTEFLLDKMQGNETEAAVISKHMASITSEAKGAPDGNGGLILHAGSGWEVNSRAIRHLLEEEDKGNIKVVNLDIQPNVLKWAADINKRLGQTSVQLEVNATVSRIPIEDHKVEGIITHGSLRYWVSAQNDQRLLAQMEEQYGEHERLVSEGRLIALNERLQALAGKTDPDSVQAHNAAEHEMRELKRLQELKDYKSAMHDFVTEAERVTKPGSHIVASDVGWDLFPGPEAFIREISALGYTKKGGIENPGDLLPGEFMVETTPIKAFTNAQFYFLYAYYHKDDFALVDFESATAPRPKEYDTRDLFISMVQKEVDKRFKTDVGDQSPSLYPSIGIDPENPLFNIRAQLELQVLSGLLEYSDRTLMVINVRTKNPPKPLKPSQTA